MKNQIILALCALFVLSSCDFKKAEPKTEAKEEVQNTAVISTALLNAKLA